jgi:hypothetical protein
MTNVNRLVYINSLNRTTGTNEDFYINENISAGPHFGPPQVPGRVKLIKAAIPFTWDNITSNNNKFTIIDSMGSYPVTIPIGNYSGSSLAPVILAAIVAAGPADTYTVTYDSATLKYTIAATGDFQLDFTVVNSAGNLLGFGNVITPGGIGSVTSTNVAGILPDYEMFVCSDLVGGSDNGVILFNQPANSEQILAVVPINACYGGIIQYCPCGDIPFYSCIQSPFSAAYQNPGSQSVPRIRLYLRWPSGNPINLEGAHWTCQLNFEFASLRP